MKNNAGIGLVSICLAVLLTGCGSNYVKLGEYKGIEGEKIVCEITDEEVNDAVEEMMIDYTTYDEITDRAAQDGDYVNIDYVLTKLDGKPYSYDEENESSEKDDDSEENLDDENDEGEEFDEQYEEIGGDDPYSGYAEDIIIGEEYIYPEVEKALIGMNTGDTKTVTAKLTDEYVDEDMAGKTAEIQVTLNSILVENTPEYNDTFVKEKLDYESTAEYEAALKEQLLAEKEEEYKYETVSQIMQQVIDNSKFSGYDKKMYAECEEEYDAGNEQMASIYGMDLSAYEELMGIDDVAKKDDILTMVHERQVIDAIAEAEGISISEEDVNQFVDGLYAEYEYDSAEDFINDYGMDYLKTYLLSEKVYDLLYENAKLTEITEEEYEQRLQDEEGYDEEETDDGEEIEVDLDEEE